MGGAINYRKPGKAQHNINLDIPSAKKIFNSKLTKKWVLSDLTWNEELKINKNHFIYKTFLEKKNSLFYGYVYQNMKNFYEKFSGESCLNDPFALSSVFLDTIKFARQKIYFNDAGEFKKDNQKGKTTIVSSFADYEKFWKDLKNKLFE